MIYRTSAFLRCSIVITLWSCALTLTTAPPQCPGSSRCTELNGVLDGSRCFFIASELGTWAAGWDTCGSYGAQMAQIHTDSENAAIWQMVMDKFGVSKSVWIALQRDPAVQGVPCCVTNDTTWWYDDPSTPAIVAGDTRVRYHGCDELDTGGESCMNADFHATLNVEVVINDVTCTDFYVPLCQFTATDGNYAADNLCVEEEPLLEITAKEAQDCALECWKTTWCRSFNYVRDADVPSVQTCQLFTWSTSDPCPTCPKTSPSSVTGTCVHYNYQP